ncbi:MAG: hypothetical protein ABIL01_35605 [Pseudomonadota bacterium]
MAGIEQVRNYLVWGKRKSLKTATQEISRNDQHAAAGSAQMQMRSSISEVSRGASETGSASLRGNPKNPSFL